MRFAAQLVVCTVIEPKSLWNILIDVAKNARDFALDEEKKEIYQPYCDHLFIVVLSALPFGGPEFLESDPKSLSELMDMAKKYTDSRASQFDDCLRPFVATLNDDDSLSRSDCSAASFLPELLSAIEEMIQGSLFAPATVPRVHLDFEVKLAMNTSRLSIPAVAVNPEFLSSLSSISMSMQAAKILEWYPPRGILRFLDAKHTKGERPLVDRIIAEDYFLDTLHFFEGNRVECAKRLARAMPLDFPYDPLLCEVIFSQMLRIPNSEFRPIMYGTLMVDLCKLITTFPRAMSACVRECFSRINVMDPSLSQILAEWLAYHISNYDYVWPWQKWMHVLEAPQYDGQRRFCIEVIERMIRLSYWERIHDVLPEEFRVLLPPKPEVLNLPSIDDETYSNLDDLEGLWAGRCVGLIRKKATAEEFDSWLKSNALEAVLGGKTSLTKMVLRALLFAGQKSYSHMIIALERYYGPLALLISEGGHDAQIGALQTVSNVWEKNTLRAVMAVDRLMTLRLISANSIIEWAFSSGGIESIEDQRKFSFAWESMNRAIDKAIARVEDALDDIHSTEKSVDDGSEKFAGKKDILQECENHEKEAFGLVIKSFLDLLDSKIANNPRYSEAKSFSDLVSLEESTSKENVIICRILLGLQSFLRRYHYRISQISDSYLKEVIGSRTDLAGMILQAGLKLAF